VGECSERKVEHTSLGKNALLTTTTVEGATVAPCCDEKSLLLKGHDAVTRTICHMKQFYGNNLLKATQTHETDAAMWNIAHETPQVNAIIRIILKYTVIATIAGHHLWSPRKDRAYEHVSGRHVDFKLWLIVRQYQVPHVKWVHRHTHTHTHTHTQILSANHCFRIKFKNNVIAHFIIIHGHYRHSLATDKLYRAIK